MHAAEREKLILEALGRTGFVSYRALEGNLDASPATIRRDLARMEEAGQIARVHGGAKLAGAAADAGDGGALSGLKGTPFDKSLTIRVAAKSAIGKAAAALCEPGEGVIIDGGTTTFRMCPHLAGKGLQVLTNSLHIVDALLGQEDTRLLVPSGTVFREQNIILAPGGEESMPRFHAGKLFMGAAAVGPNGVMQADIVLVAAQRRFIERSAQVVLLVDSGKFRQSSGAIVCGLEEIDVVVTDSGIDEKARAMLAAHAIRLVVAQ
jgi:DeoR family ulaG and ulaABCDEF operon transcriptional repressor